MCGISGIIFNSAKNNASTFSFYYLLQRIDNLEKILQSKRKLNYLYDLSWKYKNDESFLLYFHDYKERSYVEKICLKLEKFLEKADLKKLSKINTNVANNIEKIKDINWFLKNELNNTYNFVLSFIDTNSNHLNNTSIIFYKNLSTIINSINFLEMRGRDSLGISINLNFVFKDTLNKKDIKDTVYINNNKKFNSINLVLKTSNSIGYLGENAKELIKKLKSNSAFKQIIENCEILNGSIICHTRWASVGKVNDDNCHPISNINKYSKKTPYIHAFVNGDIYNYENIINDTRKKLNYLDSKCSSDTVAIPYLFSSNKIKLNNSYIRPRLNKLIGSYALALETSTEPNKVLISKSGSQGLYIGFSENNIMFSSDVYGLAENCRKYYSIPSDYFFCIDKNNFKQSLVLNSFESKNTLKVNNSDFVESIITTRDISKINYTHFLEKEIYETESILKRTCLSHINMNKISTYRSDMFGQQFKNIDRKIIKKISENSFDEIIITGMGTCYTAAVVISRYMRKILRLSNSKIIVQPHIASEGSAFYLKNKMENTLVIVIAQSGTTIDTNVYVKLAKNRGAKTISIVNKRDGDVTFLVDSSLYLGNGRDIEMAVPSTKTFNAHIITGYLLTLYFYKNIKNHNKKIVKDEFSRIIKSPILAKQSIHQFKNLSLDETFFDNFLKKKKWFMLHDDSEISASCQEVRIKLSECCYTSVPYHDVNYLNYHEITDSIVIMMIGEKSKVIEKKIRKLSKTNFVYIISSENFVKSKNIFLLKTPKTNSFYSFLPSVIFGQLLSYNIALRMDDRKKFLQQLIKNNFDKKSLTNLKNAYKQGIFYKGLENIDLITLQDLFTSKRNKLNKKKVKGIIDLIKRPIDTIKHQAKTITVGTQRIQKFKENNNIELLKLNEASGKENFYHKSLIKYLSSFNKSIKNKKHIFFYSHDLDETIIYFAINYLQNTCEKLNIKKNFHLARQYDLQNIKKNKNNLLIKFHYKNIKRIADNEINILFSDQIKNNDRLFTVNKFTTYSAKEVNCAVDIFNFSNNLLVSLIQQNDFEATFNHIVEIQSSLHKNLELIHNLTLSKRLLNLI